MYTLKELFTLDYDDKFNRVKKYFSREREKEIIAERLERMQPSKKHIMMSILNTEEMIRRVISPHVCEPAESDSYYFALRSHVPEDFVSDGNMCLYSIRGDICACTYYTDAMFVQACMVIKFYFALYDAEGGLMDVAVAEQLGAYDSKFPEIFNKMIKLRKEEDKINEKLDSGSEHETMIQSIQRVVSTSVQPEFSKMVLATNAYIYNEVALECVEYDIQNSVTTPNLFIDLIIEHNKEDASVMRSLIGINKDIEQRVQYYINKIHEDDNYYESLCEHEIDKDNCARCVRRLSIDPVIQNGTYSDIVFIEVFKQYCWNQYVNIEVNQYSYDLSLYLMDVYMKGLRRYCVITRIDDLFYIQCQCAYARQFKKRRRHAIASLGLVRKNFIDPGKIMRIDIDYIVKMIQGEKNSAVNVLNFYSYLFKRNIQVEYETEMDLDKFYLHGVYCRCEDVVKNWGSTVNLGEMARTKVFKPGVPCFAEVDGRIVIISLIDDKVVTYE